MTRTFATGGPRCPDCGGGMAWGRRLNGGTGLVTRVLVCWWCGAENPSLYGRTPEQRNAVMRIEDLDRAHRDGRARHDGEREEGRDHHHHPEL